MHRLPGNAKSYRIPASKLRRAFAKGLTGSGKTTLTERPFLVDGKRSLNIEIDQFFPDDSPIPSGSTYVDAALVITVSGLPGTSAPRPTCVTV
jgi:hypothetical protein